MRKNTSGFTIVELLIVIVIIAILAAITIVSFNGVQKRARDSQRYSDAKTIMKALELYKAYNGSYPPTTTTTMANTPGCSLGTGYSYSIATDDTWLKPLIPSVISKVPTANPGDCTRYYRYFRGGATTWGCTTLTTGWYLLQVFGAEGSIVPAESQTFKPCPESTVTMTATSTSWVFFKYDD